jgi:membrane-bound lytic murein transglycosylase D
MTAVSARSQPRVLRVAQRTARFSTIDGMPHEASRAATSPPPLSVSIATSAEDRRNFQFTKTFRIGRGDDCEVCFKNEYVSRVHAEVFFENGQWWVRDLHSSNGTFVNGQRLELIPVGESTILRLGIEGPFVALKLAPVATPGSGSRPPTKDSLGLYMDRYFGNLPAGEPVGEHTAMVRLAFKQVQTKERHKNRWIMAGLVAVILAAGGYALYLHQQAAKNKAMAQELFYSMKFLDVNIARVEKLVLDSHSQQGKDEIQNYQTRRKEMEQSYDRFLSTLHVYDSKMTEQRRLILRIARIFGECELAMPPEFATEIEAYIKKWQSSGRLAKAIRTANDNGYTSKIEAELLGQDLPPEFFYLALQESDFDQYISGPPTRKGIAKGMWQFIPETAIKYGLHVGPLVDFRRPDPGDDRHHYDRETKAAARYLKDLYSTDAQASGLLVMACYNWGENQVLPLVRGMPANPRERNFWRLLSKYRSKIPQETYDYVFYIASAAVIGENPRLFGFDFDNPLGRTGR